MIPESKMRMLSSALCDYKVSEWHSRGLRELPPKVTFFYRDGEEAGNTVPDSIVSQMLDALDGDPVRMLVRMRETMDVLQRPGLDMLAVGIEALGRSHPAGVKVQHCKGSFALEQATDPASKVFNLLTVAVATSDLVGGCDVQVASTKYRFCDGGVIEWYGETSVSSDGEGDMVDAMAGFFQKADA